MSTRTLYREFSAGRRLLGRLPHGGDLIRSIEALCREAGIETAVFSLIGAVTSATLGAYDQARQTYITFREDRPLEILHCEGNLTQKDGRPFVHAHAVLGDEAGQTVGGHLFEGTALFAGEITLLELIGSPLVRAHDPLTGLWLWQA